MANGTGGQYEQRSKEGGCEMEYKVGDKVRVRKDLCVGLAYNHWLFVDAMTKHRGKMVTIAAVRFGLYHIKEDGASYSWTDEMLEPIRNEKIVITSDGVTTTARKYDGKNLIKEAKAVCSKDDEFNFDVGAKLAMDRLMKEDKPKLYNGKVVCVDPNGIRSYTKGRIYQFKDGTTCTDEGVPIFHSKHKLRNFEELQSNSLATWLEVVE